MKVRSHSRFACCATLSTSAFALFAATPATASGFTDVYSFCSQAQCTDGNYPTAPMVADSAGNLYGTTALGGAGGWGTIFELSPKKKGGYKYRVLYSFCAQANCTDGNDPIAGLVIDTAGHLYGTTKFGGTQNGGTVFEFVHHGKVGKLKTLHSFCAQGAACTDGSEPMYDGLTYQGAQIGTPYDGTSPLYGTTIYGGENNAGFSGTVYEITPKAKGKKWKESVIWQFCSQTNCADGSQPHNGLVMDASGNLYGVTFGGGNSSGDGVVFELSRGGNGWTQTVLYNFCSAANCADGTTPESPLVPVNGGFMGTASGGGANDWGVLFSIVPNGSNSTYSDLYNFCSQANCVDGAGPIGRLAANSQGIFGATIAGGDPSSARGVMYELTPTGSYDVLHTFCPNNNCSDGAWMVGGVTLDSSGDVFGTVSEGGANSDGAVVEIVH